MVEKISIGRQNNTRKATKQILEDTAHEHNDSARLESDQDNVSIFERNESRVVAGPIS